jgi:hypothetical protein
VPRILGAPRSVHESGSEQLGFEIEAEALDQGGETGDGKGDGPALYSLATT